MAKFKEGIWIKETEVADGLYGLTIDPAKVPGVNVVGEGGQERVQITPQAMALLVEAAKGTGGDA